MEPTPLAMAEDPPPAKGLSTLLGVRRQESLPYLLSRYVVPTTQEVGSLVVSALHWLTKTLNANNLDRQPILY
jgi:hypothetical protein